MTQMVSQTAGGTAEAHAIYADSSALLRLLLEQPESAALHSFLATSGMKVATSGMKVATSGMKVESCELTIPEMLRIATREQLDHQRVELVDTAAAIELGAAVFLTYDRRQLGAARMVGLQTAAPGLDAPW